MPANLTPQYRKAEEAYRHATAVAAKIEALEDMLRLIPKHKGTEHIQGDLKSRLAKLRAASTQKKGKGGVDPFFVERHGAGQVVVLGMPNVGKSALVAGVTKARTAVAPYPFATHAPLPGMMPFEDIQIQMVDMPPVTDEGLVPGMMGALDRADGLLICLDLSAPDLLEQSEACFDAMASRGLFRPGTEAPEGSATKPMIVIGTKADGSDAMDNLEALLELRPDLAPVHPTSVPDGTGLAELPQMCFDMIRVVRIYSKQPGKPVDTGAPFTLPCGSTVLDFARAVHREMAGSLRYARVWGSAKFDGQTVQRDHVIQDGDIVELHV